MSTSGGGGIGDQRSPRSVVLRPCDSPMWADDSLYGTATTRRDPSKDFNFTTNREAIGGLAYRRECHPARRRHRRRCQRGIEATTWWQRIDATTARRSRVTGSASGGSPRSGHGGAFLRLWLTRVPLRDSLDYEKETYLAQQHLQLPVPRLPLPRRRAGPHDGHLRRLGDGVLSRHY